MKYFIIISLLFISVLLNAQNIISISFQPVDLGLGLKYDRLFTDFGLYASCSKGNYRFDDCIIKNHYKISAGGSIRMLNGNLCAGVSYHKYGIHKGNMNLKIFDPLSLEVGCNAEIKRFIAGFRFDPIKGESCIDFGIRL